MILITGKSGVGKSLMLDMTNNDNIIKMDDIIKNIFYKRNFKLYWDIREKFGKKYTKINCVNTKRLGKDVFNNPEKLSILNKLVSPYIRTYLNVLKIEKPLSIIEMAIYINHESTYKEYFDKIILIDRKEDLSNKFGYLKNKMQPIKENKIKYDHVIKENDLGKAVMELKKLIE